MIKPLANREDDFKNLKIGTGHSVGDYKTSYYVYSVFMGLDYKKLHFKLNTQVRMDIMVSKILTMKLMVYTHRLHMISLLNFLF